MSVKLMATLSPEGWVGSLADKVDKAIMYFYTSQYSQTTLYRDQMRPLAWLVATYGDKATEMARQTEDTVKTYFERLFEEAFVEINATVEDERTKLTMRAIVRDEGREYSVGHVIRISNSKVLGVFDLVNDGKIYIPV